MRAAWLAVLLSLVISAAGAAQTVRLRMATVGGPLEVPGVTLRDLSYFPVNVLEHAGAAVSGDARIARVVLFGDTLVFATLSPFIEASGGVTQLVAPVERIAGVIHVPEQFFIEILPRTYPQHVEFRAGVLHVAAPVAAPVAQAPAARPARAAATPIVILDPGHGGRDSGKIGPTGLREKDVALTLANRLAGLLRERGLEVVLTRSRDTLIALADRPRIANRVKADRPALFLSIHANSVTSSRVQGFETFFLSEARTEDERRVAEMENAAIEFEDAAPSSGGAVDQILNDMRNDFYVRASNDLAEEVQVRLASFHTGPNRGVKRAGFRVLVGALMPAVLVEVAFISNPQEARLLGTAAFQQKVAYGLADAVVAFFSRNGHLWGADIR